MHSILTLGQALEEHLAALAPKVLTFGHFPADEESRGVGYVVIQMDAGSVLYSRADASPAEHMLRWRLTVAGSSPSQTDNTLDLVRRHMADFAPFDDRRFGPCVEDEASPRIPDLSTPSDPRWSYTLDYRIDDGDPYGY